ncbi:MAG TPA: hypothetical protein VFX96_12940 [Pyrinomonadaceae bacterium]|nr:hypothetical protein [Pyrinomonadaceae bacterium]
MFAAQTFPCPNCREFINDQMQVCRYCKAPVDAHAAAAAVAEQDKINRACNSASLARNLAGVMWVFFFIRLIPMVGLFSSVGMFAGFFAVPVWVVVWWIKYGRIRTDDVDYKRARKNIAGAALLWVLLLVTVGVLEFLLVAALPVSD